MFEVERYHDFSAGHRVYGHESKCAHLHGHNYRVHFTCTAQDLDMLGRVVDFGTVKDTLCKWLEDNWDHKFLVSRIDPAFSALKLIDPEGVVGVPFNPTAEEMARYLLKEIGPVELAGTGVVLIRVRVEETRKCSATYKGDR